MGSEIGADAVVAERALEDGSVRSTSFVILPFWVMCGAGLSSSQDFDICV